MSTPAKTALTRPDQARPLTEVIAELIESDPSVSMLVNTDDGQEVSRPLIEAIFWFIENPAEAFTLAKKIILKRDSMGEPLSTTAAEVGITFEYDTSSPTEQDIHRLVMAIHQKAMEEKVEARGKALYAPARLSNSISSNTLLAEQLEALEGPARNMVEEIQKGTTEIEVPTLREQQKKPLVEAIIYRVKNPELQAVVVAIYLAYEEMRFLELVDQVGTPTSPFPEIGESVGITLSERPSQGEVRHFITQLQTKVQTENATVVVGETSTSASSKRPAAPELTPPPAATKPFDEKPTDPEIDLATIAGATIELAPNSSPEAKALLALIESEGFSPEAYTAAIEGEQIVCSIIEGIYWEKFAKRINDDTASLLARHCMAKMGETAFRRDSVVHYLTKILDLRKDPRITSPNITPKEIEGLLMSYLAAFPSITSNERSPRAQALLATMDEQRFGRTDYVPSEAASAQLGFFRAEPSEEQLSGIARDKQTGREGSGDLDVASRSRNKAKCQVFEGVLIEEEAGSITEKEATALLVECTAAMAEGKISGDILIELLTELIKSGQISLLEANTLLTIFSANSDVVYAELRIPSTVLRKMEQATEITARIPENASPRVSRAFIAMAVLLAVLGLGLVGTIAHFSSGRFVAPGAAAKVEPNKKAKAPKTDKPAAASAAPDPKTDDRVDRDSEKIAAASKPAPDATAAETATLPKPKDAETEDARGQKAPDSAPNPAPDMEVAEIGAEDAAKDATVDTEPKTADSAPQKGSPADAAPEPEIIVKTMAVTVHFKASGSGNILPTKLDLPEGWKLVTRVHLVGKKHFIKIEGPEGEFGFIDITDPNENFAAGSFVLEARIPQLQE